MAQSPEPEVPEFMKHSKLYQECLAEREEILKHKWLESEKAGKDVGINRSVLDWVLKYRDPWRIHHRGSLEKNS